MSDAEAARISNTATMDYDRARLRERWPDLVGGKSARKMGRKTLDWIDPERTAERVFGDQVEARAAQRVSAQ
jgi:hypothetical protein